MPRKSTKVAPQIKKVVGYTRVSTEDQVNNGFSLEAQKVRIQAHGTASGRSIDEIVTDAGLSGKNLKREGLQRILDGIKAGEIGTVVVVKLDRLTRSVKDLGYLLELVEKHDCALVSLSESLDTSTAAGRMIINMLGVVAQWEREQTAERVSNALEYRRNQKKVYCNVPFGFERLGDALIEVPSEIEAIKTMKQMASDGHSLRKIASHLEEQGIKPKQGASKWYAQTVKDVLTSKMTASIA